MSKPRGVKSSSGQDFTPRSFAANESSPELNSPPSQPPVLCRLSSSSVPDLVTIDLESNNPPWNAGMFSREFDHGYSRVYGARAGGILVGFLVCHAILDEGHIVSFGVRRSLRGRGFGRALMEHSIRELDAEAVASVTLEVRKSNVVARTLYDSLGFQEVGLRAEYYSDNQEDGLILKLNVRSYMDSQIEPCNKLPEFKY